MKKTIITMLIAAVMPLAAQARNIARQDRTRVTKNVEINPIATVKKEPGMCSIFHSWGFIGDSLCSGGHEFQSSNHGGYADIYDYSWSACMCRAMNVKGDNYSQGGETAHGWIAHFWDHPQNNNNNIDAKAEPNQVYMIAMGDNDANAKVTVGDVDKDVNLDDYTKNANTFAGDYAGIIQRLKSIQPRAKFFVVTIPRGDFACEAYNEVIRQMAKKFSNVFLIDLYKFAPSYKANDTMRKTFYVGGHMRAAGYQYSAWMMMTYIDYIITHNYQAFNDVAFIGTDY
jgi:hypothetical protein